METQTSSPTVARPAADETDLDGAQSLVARLGDRLRAAIRGRDDVVELVLVALLADGHVLLEDYPGSGKTTLARALGDAIIDDSAKEGIAPFRRIQFTPDLLPSDITGTNVFDAETGRFVFRRGPIFAHIVLADEINRTSPKVQAAHARGDGARNRSRSTTTRTSSTTSSSSSRPRTPSTWPAPIPLPTPQLDRFLFKLIMTHIEREAELEVLDSYPRPALELAAERPGVTRAELLSARHVVRSEVALAPAIKEAIVDAARALRADPRVMQGASTRSLVLLLPALQARAVIHGRDYVAPEDLAVLSPFVFQHRLECAPGVDDVVGLIREHVEPQVEALAKKSLAR